MKRILLSLLALNAVYSADVVTVDPAGVTTITGIAPGTAPAAGEVKIGGGQVQAQGAVTAGDVVVNRTTQATSAQAVRGDDLRLSNSRPAAGGDAATVGGKSPSAFVPVTDKGIASGVATLDASGKVPTAQLPANIGAVPAFYAMINNAAAIAISGAITATANRMHVISGTSAPYNITLPAASGIPGAVMGFSVKSYSQASGAYTLDAGASVIIAGRNRYLALVHSNVALLMSDGVNWQPLVLNLDSPWIDGGPMVIGGTTMSPAKGTIAQDRVLWRRSGDSLELRYEFRQTTGGTAGAGWFLLSIPSFAAIDLSKTTTNTAYNTTALASHCGTYMHYASGYMGTGAVFVYDATRLGVRQTIHIEGSGSSGSSASLSSSLTESDRAFSANVIVPISGW